jgi:hypothetical protein
VARGLLKAVLVTKNRTQTTRWQDVVEKAQQIQTQQDIFNERQNALNYDPVGSDKNLMFRGLSQLNNLANDQPVDEVGNFWIRKRFYF